MSSQRSNSIYWIEQTSGNIDLSKKEWQKSKIEKIEKAKKEWQKKARELKYFDELVVNDKFAEDCEIEKEKKEEAKSKKWSFCCIGR